MRRQMLGKRMLEVPVVAAGCMRIQGMDETEVDEYIHTCLELGIQFFDHADIYGKGACESLFGRVFEQTEFRREDIILQSKCGIVPGVMYDFSKEHILQSVEESLRRLRTDYLDILLLHRPDALMEPEEVAEAFNQLQQSGKVRNFGVSNHKSSQIRLLQKYISQPLVTDQLQFSLPNSSMIQSGMEVNMTTAGAIDRADSILDFCRLNDITIQTWSPFQYGFFEGVFIGSDKYPELNHCLEEIADKYHTTPTTIAAAWILRHPAHMQLIAGTTKPSRFREICAACDITLTREEWYRLYLAAGHILP